MFRGRHQQGDQIFLSIRTLNGSGVPTNPDAAPLMDVWLNGTTKLRSARIPRHDAGAVTGLFGYWLDLGVGYVAGMYQVTYSWTVGSDHGLQVDTFEVLAGGSSDGAVISMIEHRRPQASFVVYQLDGGRLRAGRNPRL